MSCRSSSMWWFERTEGRRLIGKRLLDRLLTPAAFANAFKGMKLAAVAAVKGAAEKGKGKGKVEEHE
ncbi:hypothetical protein B0A55_05423 [Friedmanniomyces simplex]|uniref:Uncharacterized protein n=1 Tax=Friedmanniomyces simplex TaxID=329884 RepID=A0A4U0XC37_9PEZI|nr:hypothetical protein B0A55_05423 [Friedmanniomyces simplex]